MLRRQTSDAYYLLAFFAFVIAVGTALLLLPASWAGPERLNPIDALFTATSAVCVTGLSTVDTAIFSRFGQTVILLLIQVGGLGVISFTSILLTIPGRRLPLRRLKTIRGFSVEGVEYDYAKIVRNIVFFTFFIEAAGAAALYPAFSGAGVESPAFAALFHSVSAFCNAGFSTFSTGLEGFARRPGVLGPVMALIVSGGIGFIVLQDLERRARGKRKRLSYHTVVVLASTGFLIVSGALCFWVLERNNAFSGLGPFDTVLNALFQSITPRTAGFNTVPQGELSQPSTFVTILLMFIGGAPGSIAGGIKVTTAFVVVLVMLRRQDENGDINVFKRRLTATTSSDAVVYFLKAFALLLCAAGALSITESGVNFGRLVFESVSAFGTVGLSLGVTPSLSAGGKLVIIATMFAGRVGLIALAFPGAARKGGAVSYPEASILLG